MTAWGVRWRWGGRYGCKGAALDIHMGVSGGSGCEDGVLPLLGLGEKVKALGSEVKRNVTASRRDP